VKSDSAHASLKSPVLKSALRDNVMLYHTHIIMKTETFCAVTLFATTTQRVSELARKIPLGAWRHKACIQLVALGRERHATSNYAHDYLCHATMYSLPCGGACWFFLQGRKVTLRD